jgi:hypothetical protein
MRHEFNEVLDNYLLEKSRKVDSTFYTYDLINRVIPRQINDFLQHDDLLVQGSVGRGNRTPFPWISMLNRNITTTTQQGLYMVFLFKKDMSGFYLTLNQGITYFEKKFGANKFEMVRRMVDYYQTQIDEGKYSFEPISLGAKKTEIGYGYEQATIISFYYEKDRYNLADLQFGLQEILKIYDEIYLHMQSRSYDDVIDQVLDEGRDFTDLYSAIKEAEDFLYQNPSNLYDMRRILVEEPPYEKQSRKYTKISTPVIRKVDYVKRAHKDAETGYLGEQLVLRFEEERLRKLGLEDYLPKVQQVSIVSDTYGFDLESYTKNEAGEILKIFIEVKTTSSKVDTEFYVSKNEINRSKELDERFWIYRVYDCYASNPKFYRAQGSIDKNFELDPVTFMAKYRFPKKTTLSK